MKHWPLILILFATGCNQAISVKPSKWDCLDYVTVGHMMDTIRAPYIIDLSKGEKRIIFIGCDHNNDSLHPQNELIARYARELHPQQAFNEGGQINDTVHYATLREAAYADGETGVLKFCADQSGFPMLNGDTPFSEELQLTLKKQSREDLFLYYVMERFVIPYHYGAYGQKAFEEVFTSKALPYFKKNGFPLAPVEQNYAWFNQLYKRKMQVIFDIANINLEAFDYINDSCHFCAVGRSSKMARDSMLLVKIERAFKKVDRLLVTFGHGHALAVEPALQKMMK